ncbi:MAG: AMP-dependent synthetase/ligase [Cyclobacteriaceae bacterium]
MNKNHIIAMIKDRANALADKVALREVFTDKNYTWQELNDTIDKVAAALVAENIKVGDRVGIFSQNMPEWTLADFGILNAAAVSVPIYATNTTGHAEYIINDAEIAIVFVGEQEQYDKIEPLLNKNKYLRKLVLLDESIKYKNDAPVISFQDFVKGAKVNHEVREERLQKVQPDDLATLIYTSGTTGDPKGVMLTHDNFLYAMEIHDNKLSVDQHDINIAFLPLSHVFERAWTLYVLYKGAENNYLRNPKEVLNAMQTVKPTLMATVPRLMEKIHEGITAKIEKSPAIQQKLFNWSVATGNKRMHLRRQKKQVPLPLKVSYRVANKLVLNRLRNLFGGNIKFMPVAGSPLMKHINEFFHSIGLNVKYGYGLTETTATVCAFDDDYFNLESIGTKMPGIEVKIGPNKEIWVKGRTVMKGYYNKPKDTEEVFEDGWFKTGDAGDIDENNNVFYRERIKQLIKTSVGKYVSPQMVESIISSDKFVDQIAIFGDNRKFVTALIVPSFEFLEDFAKSKGIDFDNKEELVNNSVVLSFFKEKIEQLQSNLPSYEKVKNFRLLPRNFSQDKDEVTPTLKIKRNVIEKQFKDIIDHMYQEKQERDSA